MGQACWGGLNGWILPPDSRWISWFLLEFCIPSLLCEKVLPVFLFAEPPVRLRTQMIPYESHFSYRTRLDRPGSRKKGHCWKDPWSKFARKVYTLTQCSGDKLSWWRACTRSTAGALVQGRFARSPVLSLPIVFPNHWTSIGLDLGPSSLWFGGGAGNYDLEDHPS